jgi:hypothetical protein
MRTSRLAALPLGCLIVAGLFAACSSSSKSGAQSDASTDALADVVLACPPMDLGGWMPPAYVHASTPRPSACPGTFISDFYRDCLDATTASDATCQATWLTGADIPHQTCSLCLVTTDLSASSYGPLISGYKNHTTTVNVAGCIELLDPAHVSCAMALQAFDACSHQACDVDPDAGSLCVLNPGDPSSFTKWKYCIAAAQTGECASYGQAADCLGTEDAGPAAGCVTGQSTRDLYNFIAPLFCGSADGG